ncbi:MAG: tetratricopeptide repeat protein [Chloroflexota bacterium]|nr:MAG: tetratricopeptide repeat protein [Chloroflexota bacterium]
MKRNLISIVILGIMMFAGLAAAIKYLSGNDSVNPETISVANQLYETRRYQEAAQVYEQLLSQGLVNSSLFYNLGNAYLAQGDHGRAILNYQRAARLDPRDADIRANLDIARARSASEYTPESANPIQSVARFSSSWMTLNELGLATLVVWFSLGFLVFAYRQLQAGKSRTFLQYGIILTALLFVTAGLSLGSRLYMDLTTPEAVIVDEVVTLNSDPGDEFATEFQLFSGTEVKLLGTQGSWAQLSGYNEAVEGWIPLSSIETVSWRADSRQDTL